MDVGVGEVPAACDPTPLLVAGALGADFRLEPEAAEDLHAARRDAGELVLNGRIVVALHEDRADAVMGEQTGGRQAIQAAADDQNRGTGIHLSLPPVAVQSGRACQ